MKEKQRNIMVELLRFVFCMLIVLFHLQQRTQIGGFFAHGNIGVSYFFLLSGRFMAAHAEKKDYTSEKIGISSYKYVLGKVRSYIVPFLLCWGISFVFYNVIRNSTIKDVLKNLINSLPEMFQLHMTGMRGTTYIIQGWYLSAMVLVIMICYPLLLKLKDNYYYTVAPIVAFFSMGIISSKYGMFGSIANIFGIFTKGFMWGLAVMNLGVFAYGLEKQLAKFRFSKCGRRAMKLLGIILIGVVLCYAIIPIENAVYDFSMTLILSMGMIVCFGEEIYVRFFGGGRPIVNLCSKVCIYLGELSLYAYLIHIVVIDFVRNIMGRRGCNSIIVLYFGSIVLTITGAVLLRGVTRYINRLFEKIKNRMIISENNGNKKI